MYSNISLLPNSNIDDEYDEYDEDGYNRSSSYNSNNTISKEIVKWTDEEDKKLLKVIEEVKASKSNVINKKGRAYSFWKEVSSKFGGKRDHGACFSRYNLVLEPAKVKGTKPGSKGKWSPIEDAKLIELAKSKSFKHWGKLSKELPGRSAKSCRERYNNYLDPNLNNAPFTEFDDSELIRLYEINGSNWKLISTHLTGKTSMCCKNRFALLKRKIKNGKLPELSIALQAHSGFFLDPLANPNLQTSHLHLIALQAEANSVRRISSSNIAIENFSNIEHIYNDAFDSGEEFDVDELDDSDVSDDEINKNNNNNNNNNNNSDEENDEYIEIEVNRYNKKQKK